MTVTEMTAVGRAVISAVADNGHARRKAILADRVVMAAVANRTFKTGAGNLAGLAATIVLKDRPRLHRSSK